MKRLARLILLVAATVLCALAIFVLMAYVLEFRPKDIEAVDVLEAQRASVVQRSDTVSVLCWNIGYCGLGRDMDFFLDGGTKTRTSKDATLENLEAIIQNIKTLDVDIVLLQEVDIKSRRSYRINQREALLHALQGYNSAFAFNFKSFFVPIPLNNPLGSAQAGLMILSKFDMSRAQRVQYPVSEKFPSRSFNLKRALLSCVVDINGRDVIIANTHNSAYDDGLSRKKENDALAELFLSADYSEHPSIIAGDWNQLPPNYKLSDLAASDTNYRPIEVAPDFLIDTHHWVADTSRASMRYLDKPFRVDGSDKLAITDFFLVSNDLHVLSVETLDLGFENSDHQPVLMKVVF